MGGTCGKEYQPGNFLFDSFRDNENIGNDQIKRQDVYMTYENTPSLLVKWEWVCKIPITGDSASIL